MLKLKYEFELVNPDGSIADAWEDWNLIPQVGVTQLANAMFGDVAPISTYYVGLFLNNYVPSSSVTAADLQTSVGEFTGYSETSRPLWERVYDGVGAITNEAARAEFTCTVDRRLYGGFLVSSPTKGGNTGNLLSIARFTTPRDVVTGQVLRVRASLTLIPTEVA